MRAVNGRFDHQGGCTRSAQDSGQPHHREFDCGARIIVPFLTCNARGASYRKADQNYRAPVGYSLFPKQVCFSICCPSFGCLRPQLITCQGVGARWCRIRAVGHRAPAETWSPTTSRQYRLHRLGLVVGGIAHPARAPLSCGEPVLGRHRGVLCFVSRCRAVGFGALLSVGGDTGHVGCGSVQRSSIVR